MRRTFFQEYSCRITGIHCPKVKRHFEQWGRGIRLCAQNKMGKTYLTCYAPEWLCVEHFKCRFAMDRLENRR